MQEILVRSLRGDIRLQTHFEDGLWPVEVDAGEFELAVINICVNARDAMSGEGTIRIAACNRPGFSFGGINGAIASSSAIADTGAGIAADHLARVFDPFFTTKDIGKGSGLGLAQVYGFVNSPPGTSTSRANRARARPCACSCPALTRSPASSASTTRPSNPAQWAVEGQVPAGRGR